MSPAQAPPQLYIITDRRSTGGRPLPEVVQSALSVLPKGARARRGVPRVAVQLRERDLEGGSLFVLAKQLRAITRAAGAQLYVNDRIDVAVAAGADGVHLGWGSLSIDDARVIAPGLAVALSTHSRLEAESAAQRGASFVVFGPVFETPSKAGLLAPQGLTGLADVATSSVPVLALGGVDAQNGRDCLAAGADGLACIRTVMAAADPAAAMQSLLSCFERVSTRAASV